MSEIIANSNATVTTDVIVFENVADQYVKDENVQIHFTILNDSKIHPDADRIGLIRVGTINAKDCLVDVPIALDTSKTSSAVHHGSATFLSSTLKMSDEEFHQFCYIDHQGKILALSIPFQLNCSSDDVDLLTSVLGETTIHRRHGFITVPDGDQDDLLVVHTKGMLLEDKLRQENRQLLEKNRRLEEQHEQLQIKIELTDAKFNEYLTKTRNDMQLLAQTHKTTIDELASRQRIEEKLRSEFEASANLCLQYQNESLRFAERCRALEDSHTQLTAEHNRLRSQLVSSNQLVDEQTIQLVELEKSLINSNEALKTSAQYQNQLEQQLRDVRLSTEKYQKSIQNQLDAFTKQASQQENQIHALQTANSLLKEELKTVNDDKTFLLTMIEEDKLQSKGFHDEIQQVQMENVEAKKQVEILRKELEDNRTMVAAVNEIQKRCVKHQKGEIEAKKELAAEKQLVVDLKKQIDELTRRLTAGSEEYKNLYRKYVGKCTGVVSKANPTTLSNETGLNEEALVSLLRNSYELQQQQQQKEDAEEEEEEEKVVKPKENEEVQECPMCYWEFPNHLTLESKKQHIDAHFD